ncbi:MAG: CBS domain-containing protein [Sulfolobales archaeon]|nr:CBS domain-containing protein [Sulfolobales archaeon]MDW8083312.1 CBS domain-containing protein [Sulfolobales archaeon]
MKLPNPRRMYERARWLRSDGKPNFKTVIREKEPELRSLLIVDIPVVSPQIPLLKCIENMWKTSFRAAVVVKAGELSGILTFHDIADYLGGGSRFKIVAEHYKNNLYRALSIPVEELMSRKVVYVSINDTLRKTLELMITLGYGLIPVLDTGNKLLGVITEGSVIRLYSGRISRRPVSEFMTKNVITADESSSLLEIHRLMVSTGVRRIPLTTSDGRVRGVITWRSIIDFIGSHRIYEVSKSGDVGEALEVEASNLAERDIIVVDPQSSLENLVKLMFERKLDYGLVAEGEVLRGILTERDIMFAVLWS